MKYSSRWAPTNYKWSYNPYKWGYKWLTGGYNPYKWSSEEPVSWVGEIALRATMVDSNHFYYKELFLFKCRSGWERGVFLN